MARNAHTTIIRRIEDSSHDAHHGGAWKVAYADFMTAMMAFFLLLWILSSSDEQKLKGIAEYFTDATQPGGTGVLDGASIGPPGILNATNGVVLARGSEVDEQTQTLTAKWEVRDVTGKADAAGIAGTDTQLDSVGKDAGQTVDAGHDGSLVAMAQPDAQRSVKAEDAQGPKVLRGEDHSQDDLRFDQLEAELMQAMQDAPDLRPLKKNIVFEKTDTGLRILIVDQEGQPMFALGQTDMLAATKKLMTTLGEALAELPNELVISGHTDAVPFTRTANYDNWDLSSDRANEARRILVRAGVDADRLRSVSGKAHTEPLVADAPLDPSNRRISFLLQYQQSDLHTERSGREKLATQVNTTPESAPVLDQNTFDSLRSVLR